MTPKVISPRVPAAHDEGERVEGRGSRAGRRDSLVGAGVGTGVLDDRRVVEQTSSRRRSWKSSSIAITPGIARMAKPGQ